MKASPRIALHVTAATLAAVGLAEVKVFCTRLDAAQWLDGRETVGDQGAKVKNNRQLSTSSPLARPDSTTSPSTRM